MAGPESLEWVIVCGGFHDAGGMDRANAALAEYLTNTGARVHLVAHDVIPRVAALPRLMTHVVPRPAGSVLAGEFALERRSRRLANELRRERRSVLVVANGGNILHGDVNWVHSVHHAWPAADVGAPPWFKVKNRAARWWYRRRERRAIRAARVVVANSNRTRDDVIAQLGVVGERVHTVYLGSADAWRVPSSSARERARHDWAREARPLVAFVGALGHDTNKGIDTLLAAWSRLRRTAGWDADLVVAGPGRTARWERLAGNGDDVRFVGFTDRVGELLDAADLLVSPVRYEAYGLAMHEAICRGVPVLTSRTAGIAERFDLDVRDLLLERADDVEELTSRMVAWRADRAGWARRFACVGNELRAYTLRDMAARIARVAMIGALDPRTM